MYDLHINLSASVYFNCEKHIYLFNNEEQNYFYNSLDEVKKSYWMLKPHKPVFLRVPKADGPSERLDLTCINYASSVQVKGC